MKQTNATYNKLKEWGIWASLFIVPLLFYPQVLRSAWVSNSDVHALLEFWAASTALIAAIIVLLHFFATGRRFFLMISLGFILQGGEDFVHAIYSFTRIWPAERVGIINFVPGTYVTGRIILVICILIALYLTKEIIIVREYRRSRESLVVNMIGFFSACVITLIIINSPLPKFIFPGQIISRPVDLIAAVFYLGAFFFSLNVYHKEKYHESFMWNLTASLIFGFIAQIYMVHSQVLYDALFDMSHLMKIVSYMFPIVGTGIGTFFMYKKEEALAKALSVSKQELVCLTNQMANNQTQLVQSEKSIALGELTAGVAHELNQPLNVMKIIVQSQLRDIKKDCFDINEGKAELSEMLLQINGMAQTVDHMRVFSMNIDKNQIQELFDVNEVVENAFKLFGVKLKEHGIMVIKNLSVDLPKVLGNSTRIEQAFLNLIFNARDAVEKFLKSERRHIEVRTCLINGENGSSMDGSSVVIAVTDFGDGIPKNVQQKIFQPFFTNMDSLAPDGKPSKGAGLGLSVANQIVREHQGRIRLKSEQGKGSTFEIILPGVYNKE